MMTDSGIAPFRTDAEQTLLGILMAAPQLAETCGVMPGDLCPEMGHPEILGAIVSTYETLNTVDPVLVSQELIKRDQLTRIGDADQRGQMYLFALVQAGQSPGSVGFYARIIREATMRRNLHQIGQKLVRTATTQGDLDVVLDNAAMLAMSLGLVVDTPVEGNAPIHGLSLMEEFVDEPSPPHTWVIPGIAERQDRIMIVAGEGLGKSVLARQVCTLLAAGRHPFMPTQKITPRRTLLIDLENPPDLVRRGLRGLVTKVREDGLSLGDRAWRWNRPAGMDLRSTTDRQLMARVIELTRPDLIAIGPLYKASQGRGNDTYEIAAAETAQAFDHFRERYGCVFWIEHHAPKAGADGHRSGPIGSSYWMRWPEFGLLLKAAGEEEPNVYLLDRFRGDRDERAWPDKLIKRAGRWPWTPDWDDQAVRQDLFDAIDGEQADNIRREREAREHNTADLAGSGIQRSTPVAERYFPDRDDDEVSTLSKPSGRVSTEVPREPTPGPGGGPGGGGEVSQVPNLGASDLRGSAEELPEPPFDWEGDDSDPIY